MIRSSLLALLFLFAATVATAEDLHDYEESLLQTINDIQQLNHDQALTDTREFIQQYPTSKVGQLLLADLLMAKAGVLSGIGSGIASDPELGDLTFEIKQRLSHKQTPALDGYLPDSMIKIADDQPYILLIDQSESRLYVYRNEQGTPVLETDYYLTIGLKGYGKEERGDQKTPIGIYHVTRHIDDKELPDLYGRGAFPVNYPNAWDIRKNRSGAGIWLHGTPSYTYNRAPRASNGCMVISNNDFLDITQYIDPRRHTPVINTKKINWISTAQWNNNRQSMQRQIERWIADWESNDLKRYISHYSESDFHVNGRDYRQWESYKRRVNRNKKNINIEYSNLNIFKYPGEDDLVLMQFDQSYRSSNLDADNPKEMYWKQQGDDWKIVYEAVRSFAKPERGLAQN